MLAVGDLVTGGADLLGDVGVEQPELAVHARGVRLDAPEPVDHRRRYALARHREVVDRLGGFSAPELFSHFDIHPSKLVHPWYGRER